MATWLKSRRPQGALVGLVMAGLSMGLLGCEVDSFMDPSIVGRWERTPVVVPILDQLDVIDEPDVNPPGLTPIRAEDLIPEIREYVIGSGDLLTVTVFELVLPGVEAVQTRRVDELGVLRLPFVGSVNVDGQTPSELERTIAGIIEDKGLLQDPTVSVIVQEGRQNTFSVIGEPRTGGTAIGNFRILEADFRILDAMALAGGVSGQIKTIYVIRQVDMSDRQGKGADPSAPQASAGDTSAAPDVLDEVLPDLDGPAMDGQPDDQGPPAPQPLEQGMDDAGRGSGWVFVDDQWVRTQTQPDGSSQSPTSAELPPVPQRIIEVPYDRLLEGDMRYNMVIRPGDVIRVPPPSVGNVYIGGAINRPGTYALPGEKDLTLTQLVFAAGNLSGLAMPERVDLTRRIGPEQEATLRLNLREIFNGTQPNIFLKPDDQVNIGTSFVATPLAVFRNGLRVSYGFGFILDRNFGTDVFPP